MGNNKKKCVIRYELLRSAPIVFYVIGRLNSSSKLINIYLLSAIYHPSIRCIVREIKHLKQYRRDVVRFTTFVICHGRSHPTMARNQEP